MKLPSLLLPITVAVLLAACGQDSPSPTGVGTPSVVTSTPDTASSADDTGTPVASSLFVLRLPRTGIVGQQWIASARLRDAKGESIVSARLIAWGVSNETVATVEWFDGDAPEPVPASALVTLLGQGSTTITASFDGLTANAELTAVSDPPLSDALVIESFSMIEFAYPERPELWYYAPQVVLADQTGSGVDVIGVQFSIGDWGDVSYCAAARPVDSGASLELFREVYGDYELSFDKQGVRAGSGEATAAIYFVERDGTPGKALAVGPVTPGGFPTTYTGGAISDPWNCTFPYVPQ